MAKSLVKTNKFLPGLRIIGFWSHFIEGFCGNSNFLSFVDRRGLSDA